jgi:hypothetical protein
VFDALALKPPTSRTIAGLDLSADRTAAALRAALGTGTPGSGNFLRGDGAWAAAAGSVATDSIFDAKGDLAVGTGADTAARLAVGAKGTYPMADSTQTTGLVYVKQRGGSSPTVSGGHASDDWFLPPGRIGGTASSQSFFVGNLWYATFTVDRPITVTGAAIYCSSSAVGSLVRGGIVALDDEAQPSSLITEFATFDTTSTGLKSVTGLTVSLPPGEYAECVKSEGGNPTLTYWNTPDARSNGVSPSGGGAIRGSMFVSTTAGAYANPPAKWTSYQTSFVWMFLRWVIA